MVRVALTPLAEVQSMAHVWLERYFAKYDDFAPNRDEVRLMIMEKPDVY